MDQVSIGPIRLCDMLKVAAILRQKGIRQRGLCSPAPNRCLQLRIGARRFIASGARLWNAPAACIGMGFSRSGGFPCARSTEILRAEAEPRTPDLFISPETAAYSSFDLKLNVKISVTMPEAFPRQRVISPQARRATRRGCGGRTSSLSP
ncbi:MAG: hypothetical protein ACLRSW_17840 [Christensenellaceae bacterium]